MRNKYNRIISRILIITILFLNSMFVYASGDIIYSNYEDNTKSYDLEWSTINDISIITSIKNDCYDISYSYDAEGYRNSKTVNDITTYFSYENNVLVEEITDEIKVTYIYDKQGDNVIPSGCIINDGVYSYLRDEKNLITGIIDESNTLIVKYQYNDKGRLIAILGELDGKWIDKTDDNNFIGNINRIIAEGSYYDKETGWYYQYRRFFDPLNNIFVCNVDINKEIVPYDIFSDFYDQAISMKNKLLASSTYGTSISYSSTWYNNLSEVEIMARLIYGESNNNISQLRGVAWVLVNRKDTTGFPNTFTGVCTASGQFAAITGGATNSQNSRVPDTTSSRWKNATELACILSVCGNGSNFSGVIDKPLGYISQRYFLSKSYFLENTRNVNWTTGIGEYQRGSTWYEIKDIHQLGDPTGNVFFEYK